MQEKQTMKGRNFLKVTGILMIIGGAINILILGIGSIFSLGILREMGLSNSATLIAAIVAVIVIMLGGALELVAGILGIKKSNSTQTVSCMVFGFIILVLNVLGLILAGAGNTGSLIISIAFGIAVPVLYLIGAFMNKKGVNTMPAPQEFARMVKEEPVAPKQDFAEAQDTLEDRVREVNEKMEG